MYGRDLFEAWAPPWQERWTRYAKPALFVNIEGYLTGGGDTKTPVLPSAIIQYNNQTTAIIVDLPGASGVENGLALAKLGFRPVPLYNGIHEKNIGALVPAIDHTPIVEALKTGAGYMRKSQVRHDAPPAFLLDYDRNKTVTENEELFDNRWSVDFEDFPDAEYMKQNDIKRVVVWTKEAIRYDLLPIIESYKAMGIEIKTHIENPSPQPLTPMMGMGGIGMGGIGMGGTGMSGMGGIGMGAAGENPLLGSALREDVRKFENGRFGLLLICGVTIVNLFFMMISVREAPLWYTSPSIMWLTYLWVPEIVGDVLAFILAGVYIAFYFLSQRHRVLLPAALAYFGLDTVVFYVYVVYYSATVNPMEWLAELGILLLIMPICFLVLLVRGVTAYKDLSYVDNDEYFEALNNLDVMQFGLPLGGNRHRRHFRGYRGFGGYGGSGLGGYHGRGHRSYRGFGGGFGGGCSTGERRPANVGGCRWACPGTGGCVRRCFGSRQLLAVV